MDKTGAKIKAPAWQPTPASKQNQTVARSPQPPKLLKLETEGEASQDQEHLGEPKAGAILNNVAAAIAAPPAVAPPQSTPVPEGIQPKLTIGAPGDRYEQEADRVAEQVVQRLQTSSPAGGSEGNGGNDQVQRKPQLTVAALNPQPQETTADLDSTQPRLQCQRQTGATEASPDFEAALNRTSGGQPLAPQFRLQAESLMGADFSGVKVHTDGAANQLNQSIQAKAFTNKQDIFFRQGQYNPTNSEGQKLLAHELTHVMQQNGGAVQRMSNTVQRDGGDDEYENLEKDEESAAYKDVGKTLIAAYRMIDQVTKALGKDKDKEAMKSIALGLAGVGIKVATSLIGIPGIIGIDGSDIALNLTTASIAQQGVKTGVSQGLGLVESNPVKQLDVQKNALTLKGAIENKIKAKVGNLNNCAETLKSLTGFSPIEKIYKGARLFLDDEDECNKSKGDLIRDVAEVVKAMNEAVADLDLESFGDLVVKSANKKLFIKQTQRTLQDVVDKYNEKADAFIDALTKWESKHIESKPLLANEENQKFDDGKLVEEDEN